MTDAEQKIRNKMPWAWEKANRCKGLSTNDAMVMMEECLREDDKTELADLMIKEGYDFYGKPHLVRICQLYGINWRELDNNIWCNQQYGKEWTADQILSEKGILHGNEN